MQRSVASPCLCDVDRRVNVAAYTRVNPIAEMIKHNKTRDLRGYVAEIKTGKNSPGARLGARLNNVQ